MINEKLVQQVREGKASIEYKYAKSTVKNLNAVMRMLYPSEMTTDVVGGYKFYFNHPDRKGDYVCRNINPIDLTPIPLDRFFKRQTYKLVKQYEGSDAELGEVVYLSNFGEYCPNNSLRGYKPEEIENNECWQPLDDFFKGEEDVTSANIECVDDDIVIKYSPAPPPQSPLPSGVQTVSVKFGDYVNVPQKRYGAKDEIYLHKVIGVLQSNLWMDVPAIQHKGMVVHNTTEDVVSCIVCGVGEDRVIRYRLKDCTLTTPSLPPSGVQTTGAENFLNNKFGERVKYANNTLGVSEVIEALEEYRTLATPSLPPSEEKGVETDFAEWLEREGFIEYQYTPYAEVSQIVTKYFESKTINNGK